MFEKFYIEMYLIKPHEIKKQVPARRVEQMGWREKKGNNTNSKSKAQII